MGSTRTMAVWDFAMSTIERLDPCRAYPVRGSEVVHVPDHRLPPYQCHATIPKAFPRATFHLDPPRLLRPQARGSAESRSRYYARQNRHRDPPPPPYHRSDPQIRQPTEIPAAKRRQGPVGELCVVSSCALRSARLSALGPAATGAATIAGGGSDCGGRTEGRA
ncbi:unnamed protein product [Mycena citricolor]|uniref:Uncharacterized protein n=1 Tax=Mycena citricolor TaxID=2018698 RepID=A0AAD2GUU7_9AGAR|nr:unnamed protein product [Mycena citricolor]